MRNKGNLIENKILNYNDFNYFNNKMSYRDYVIDKYNIIHNQLYDAALDKLVQELGINKDDYKFIEIRKDNYLLPSDVYVKLLQYPFSIKKYSLAKYWDTYAFYDENRKILSTFLPEDDNINAFEVIEINYVSNKVKFRNKNTENIIERDLSYLNDETKYNVHSLSLIDTFGYKINNKIYGE